jgi:prevent-host-death family protein
MPTYTVAEAKNQLSKLLNQALDGAAVTITRHGKPIVNLVAVKPGPRPMTAADLDDLAKLRASLPLLPEPAVDTLRRMRDEADAI